jgi:hypothetical protein
MEYDTYRIILFLGSAVLLFIEVCIFISLSNRLLAEMIEKLFKITRLDHQTLLMNFCGIHIDFKSSRRFRLSMIGQLAIIAWIILLLNC